MNIFEQAVRQQLRFDFNGQISIEQLYAVRKTVKFKEDLIAYEELLQNQVESFGKSSRRTSTVKSKAQKDVELRLDIVSALLDEIEADEIAAKEKANKDVRRQELLLAKAELEAQEIKKLTKEEIDAQLALLQ